MQTCSNIELSVAPPALADSVSSKPEAKKILIIEDTEAVREIIRETLDFEGFDVVDAEDGVSGVALAREHAPDLILCDINMPNLDGYDTLSMLKDESRTASIPFVFLTGASDRTFHRKGMELGADDYLTKPFTATELIAAVNTRLKKKEDVRRQAEEQLEELRCNIRVALPHELRTPLNGIIGISSMMTEDGPDMTPEDILQNSIHIHTAAMRLHRLIENFLLCAQLELAANDPDKAKDFRIGANIEAESLIRETAQERARSHQREQDLTLHLDAHQLAILPDHFKKVVEEIVDNAFKFSREGSSVCVMTHCEDGRFCLSVSDQGRGMTREQIEKIGLHMQFERQFYEQQGAGLGLGIVKRLAELVDGELRIESIPNEITNVRVFFPCH